MWVYLSHGMHSRWTAFSQSAPSWPGTFLSKDPDRSYFHL